eukprot:1158893-Pelagomonas_calceolata.AAC.10
MIPQGLAYGCCKYGNQHAEFMAGSILSPSSSSLLSLMSLPKSYTIDDDDDDDDDDDEDDDDDAFLKVVLVTEPSSFLAWIVQVFQQSGLLFESTEGAAGPSVY